MHLHEVEQHLIEAFNAGTMTRREYLKHAGAVRELDELMQRLPSTDKRRVFGLHQRKRAVLEHQRPA